MIGDQEIREELIRWLDQGRVQPSQIAELLNIPRSRVTEMRNRKRRVQQQEMPILVEFLKMGEAAAVLPEGAIPVTGIPHLGEVPAGPWREAIKSSSRYIPAPQPGMPDSAYALTVTGNSMDKVAHDGATIIIDPEDRDLFDRWFYVIRNGDGEVTFKQYRENPARLVPCSNDPAHQVIPVASREYEVIGRVILITMSPDQAALD